MNGKEGTTKDRLMAIETEIKYLKKMLYTIAIVLGGHTGLEIIL